MNDKDLKKIVELQGKIIKARERIRQDIERHNRMVVDELRPMVQDVLHNTIYEHNGILYKRGKIFTQLQYEDYGLGIKAEGLATLRHVEVTKDATPDDTASGSSTPVSE